MLHYVNWVTLLQVISVCPCVLVSLVLLYEFIAATNYWLLPGQLLYPVDVSTMMLLTLVSATPQQGKVFSHKFPECVIRIKNGLIRCHWCYGHIYVGVSNRNIIGVWYCSASWSPACMTWLKPVAWLNWEHSLSFIIFVIGVTCHWCYLSLVLQGVSNTNDSVSRNVPCLLFLI